MEFPKNNKGLHYIEVLAQLSAKRNVKRYLEIGVRDGQCFEHVRAETAVGVDPEFVINHNIAANKKKVSLFHTTSDRFFQDVDVLAEMGGHPDLSFLDGMHLFEFLLRDFYNTERISARNSLIALHDCLPLNEAMAHRDVEAAMQLGASTRHPGWWTGDVWKVVAILRKYRPDLRVIMTDAHPTGMVFVTNLDPTSTVLSDNYHDIVFEFAMVPNTMDSMMEFYANNKAISPDDILSGMNHSLFFTT